MLPLGAFLKHGDQLFQYRYGLMMAEYAKGRYYFIVKDDEFALPNCGMRLFIGYQTREIMRFGLVLDMNPFYFSYVMDRKVRLTTYRYYPEYSVHPLDLL